MAMFFLLLQASPTIQWSRDKTGKYRHSGTCNQRLAIRLLFLLIWTKPRSNSREIQYSLICLDSAVHNRSLSLHDDATLNSRDGSIVISLPKLEIDADSLVIEAYVDAKGRVQDYRILSDPETSKHVLPEVKRMLIFTTFRPALSMGRPTPSRAVLSFSKISVRGRVPLTISGM
jgi:hypothetical protein